MHKRIYVPVLTSQAFSPETDSAKCLLSELLLGLLAAEGTW